MPQFRYEVKRAPGQSASGVIEAESQRAAVARLRDLGYIPVAVEEDSGKPARTLKHTLSRIRLKDRNVFLRQLANLFESGMPITRALGTLIQQTENPKLTVVIEEIRDDVQRGSTLAEAFERHPKVFSAIHCNLVRAGEAGGMLDEVFWRLVAFGEQEEELRGKAVSALVYPIFLLIMGSISVFILVSFVFPKFVVIFNDFNARLPWPTLVVMGLCSFMGRFWWAVLLAISLLAAAGVSYRRSDSGRKQLDHLVLRLPVIGKVIQKYEMAKFARTLGTLLDNGVPILSALRITEDTLNNTAIASELNAVQGRVAEGDSISESLDGAVHFPPLVVNMFAVGEESGRLGAITKRIAEAYDAEVDRAVKGMAALFEPLMIVVMGAIIGFLVIAMLLPMLTLSANVS
ncbi:MAG: type II secretion system F family protein [Candidatus Hydrogenedentes bacterium]|nr:type II secretion system F family protein [Candidatus Hydrogenedentota bacterium]